MRRRPQTLHQPRRLPLHQVRALPQIRRGPTRARIIPA